MENVRVGKPFDDIDEHMLTRAIRADRPLMIALALSILLAAYQAMPDLSPAPTQFDARCDELDRIASGAVAALVTERSTSIERQLGDALFRLHRARRNCRFGWPNLAQMDYAALIGGVHRLLP